MVCSTHSGDFQWERLPLPGCHCPRGDGGWLQRPGHTVSCHSLSPCLAHGGATGAGLCWQSHTGLCSALGRQPCGQGPNQGCFPRQLLFVSFAVTGQTATARRPLERNKHFREARAASPSCSSPRPRWQGRVSSGLPQPQAQRAPRAREELPFCCARRSLASKALWHPGHRGDTGQGYRAPAWRAPAAEHPRGASAAIP